MADRRHDSTGDNVTGLTSAEDVYAVSHDGFDADALKLAEQSAGIGVWSIDLTTGLARGTAQYFRIMGLEPTSESVPMAAVRALRHPEDRDRVVEGFHRALEGGADSYEIEYRIIRPDGAVRWIFGRGRVVRDGAGKPVRYSGVDIDITERKAAEAELAKAKQELERMNHVLERRVRERTAELAAEADRRAQAEARLHQAQKMEAVGQLTGGIAHDFNNALQVIIGNLDAAKLALRRGDLRDARSDIVVLAALETAERASRNAKETVQRLLAFSRMQTLAPSVVDANALIAEMADMIGHTLGETIAVTRRLQPDLWATFADRNQLQSALLNLVVNARDAMPQGGKLVIETSNADVAHDASDELAPGHYVMLVVSDTGCGIPREHLSKVFDPFFSTKDPSKGSGLGLSMVYGFVRQSGGHVRIESEVGAGSTIRMYLPRLARPHETAAIAAHASVPPTHAPAAAPRAASAPSTTLRALPNACDGETVLLVEDYEDARRFAAAALESLGYAVLQAADGPGALALLGSPEGAHIDLLFTDVVLPNGMSGRSLAEAVRARRPGLPVLFTTGYTRESIVGDGHLDASVRLLTKPYSLESLAANVREALDLAAASAARSRAASPQRAARILVVDDNRDLALTLSAMLEQWGHTTSVVNDGPSALKALQRFNADVALLDIGLPQMDGFELARQIRSDPRHGRLRLVALSGHIEDERRKPSPNAAFHAYVQKPIDFPSLAALVAEQLASNDE
jgi:PAS domain S-box-containing protein